MDILRGRNICWTTVDDETIIDEITETQEIVKFTLAQAFEEFERAKVSFQDAYSDERARKDSVRSCVSAMEAIIKEYGGDKDIREASQKLRGSNIWGNDNIVKDGDALFSTMHRLYPDLRHGSIDTSIMSLEEAEYWIGRINVYLRYIKKMAVKNGVE